MPLRDTALESLQRLSADACAVARVMALLATWRHPRLRS